MTNYCGITTDQIAFISDTTPIKQGKLSPGAHIPVKPHAEFTHNYRIAPYCLRGTTPPKFARRNRPSLQEVAGGCFMCRK